MFVTHSHPTCRLSMQSRRASRPQNQVKLTKIQNKVRATVRNFASLPDELKITDTTLRDSIKKEWPAKQKFDLYRLLTKAGFEKLECGSIDNELLTNLELKLPKTLAKGSKSPSAVSGIHNFNRIIKPQRAKLQVSLFSAASDVYSQKMFGATFDDALPQLASHITKAKENLFLTKVYLSCVFKCPYDGIIPSNIVAERCIKLLQLGCDEIVAIDTMGKATAKEVQTFIKSLREQVLAFDPAWVLTSDKLTFQFLDRDMDKVEAALESNIAQFEASLKPANNKKFYSLLSTEDLLAYAQRRGMVTGIKSDIVSLARRKLENIG
jgi:hydroxymethylglutaryl-CoA lyase